MFTTLRLDFRPDAVAVLTFDQPGSKANVLTSGMWTDLEAAVDSLTPRTDLKGLVLASAKPGIFIAGADLKLLADAPGPNDPAVRAFIEHGLRVLEKLEALPFPTCAAIDGAALGGGLEVALACDYRVVGTNPKVALGLPEVKLGLIPGWGGTQRLPRIVGVSEAAEMLTSGRSDSGSSASVMGLTEPVVDSEKLIESAVGIVLANTDTRTRAKRGGQSEPDTPITATADTVAARAAVRVLTDGAVLALKDAIKLETAAFMQLAGSDESKRLIAAFFASRAKPK